MASKTTPIVRPGFGLSLADVEQFWARLRRTPPAAQRKLVNEKVEFQSGPLSRFLCKESIRVAASDPQKALRYAELAVFIARKVRSQDSIEGSKAEPYALAHHANAHRAAGDLPAADRTFGECDRLWKPGTSSLLYDDATVYVLKATLRRHLAPLFKAQALPRETLAALGLFRQAAEAGKASAGLAQQLLAFLRRARHDPRLVFNPA